MLRGCFDNKPSAGSLALVVLDEASVRMEHARTTRLKGSRLLISAAPIIATSIIPEVVAASNSVVAPL